MFTLKCKAEGKVVAMLRDTDRRRAENYCVPAVSPCQTLLMQDLKGQDR
jgi:hypothetical protein